ncbi:coiled-coil domain-containing protein [Citrobacter koseri]|uniref:hypothetical protein n=1 Tax=Citrobacter koseri TaxID=545 RepID=UPI001F284181|nr:hypothetical protein [Citrobacter koseri]
MGTTTVAAGSEVGQPDFLGAIRDLPDPGKRDLPVAPVPAAPGEKTARHRDARAKTKPARCAVSTTDADLARARRALEEWKSREERLEAENRKLSGALRVVSSDGAATADLRKQLVEAQKQLANLAPGRDSLSQSKDELTHAMHQLTAERGDLLRHNAELGTRLRALYMLTDTLQSSSETMKKNIADAENSRATDAKEKIGLEEKLREVQTSLSRSTTDLEGARARIKDLTNKLASDTAVISRLHDQAAVASGDNAALKQQIATLTSGRDVLRVKTDAAATGYEAPVTEEQKQEYASGVMFAEQLKKSLSLQKTLGLTPVPEQLLSGILDGVNGSLRMDPDAVSEHYGALVTRMGALEKSNYQASVKQTEELTAGARVIKRNGSIFFVEKQKGRVQVNQGDSVKFDMSEAVVSDGHILRDSRDIAASVNKDMPYIVAQALLLAGRGGKIEVYCLASDAYLPEEYPEGVFAWTLLKYTIAVG